MTMYPDRYIRGDYPGKSFGIRDEDLRLCETSARSFWEWEITGKTVPEAATKSPEAFIAWLGIKQPDGFYWNSGWRGMRIPGTWMGAVRRLEGRDERRIGPHTYILKRDASKIVVKYYSTEILTYYDDNRLVLNVGAWPTQSSASRINAALYKRCGTWSTRLASWKNTLYLWHKWVDVGPWYAQHFRYLVNKPITITPGNEIVAERWRPARCTNLVGPKAIGTCRCSQCRGWAQIVVEQLAGT